MGSIMGPSRCPAPRPSTGGRRPSGALGQRPPHAFPVPTLLSSVPPARGLGRNPLGQQGQCQPSSVSATHPYGFALPPPSPALSLSFPRLHGDSPPRSPASQPLPGILGSARLIPPSSGALVPAVLSPPPGVSPEAASSFPTVTSISQPCPVVSSGETTLPLTSLHLPQPHQRFQKKSHPQHRQGLSGLFSALGLLPPPASHAEVRLVSHFLLSPAWQTGKVLVLRFGEEVCGGLLGRGPLGEMGLQRGDGGT